MKKIKIIFLKIKIKEKPKKILRKSLKKINLTQSMLFST